MVMRRFSLSVVLLLALHASGCGLQKWWGESPVDTGVIEMPSSQSDCHPLPRILEGEEEESKVTFECWAGQVNTLWTKVVGREKFALADDELDILIRKGILQLGGGVASDRARVFGIKRLMGIGSILRKHDLDSWLELARSKRAEIRSLYRKSEQSRRGEGRFDYAEVARLAAVAAPFLKKMDWAMDSYDLSSTLVSALDITDSDIQGAVKPGAQVLINLFNAVCPTFTKKDVWNTSELGDCLLQMGDHFRIGAPWLEFVFNPSRIRNQTELDQAKAALLLVNQQMETWFSRPELSSIYVSRWIDLSRAMGVMPPDNLVDSLELIRRFNPASDGRVFHPTLFLKFFKMLRSYHSDLFSSMGPFLLATSRGGCGNQQAESWLNCTLPKPKSLSHPNPLIELAHRVRNQNYGQKAVPLNGQQYSWILFFHMLSGEIIDIFAGENSEGEKSTVVSANLRKKDDDVLKLITVGLTGFETVSSFIDNFKRKINGLPFVDPDSANALRGLDPKGLAKLVTMGNDLLVQRSPEERNALEKVLSLVTNLGPKSSLFLDRIALTAVLATVDSLGAYKKLYVDHLNVYDSDTLSIFEAKGELDDGKTYLLKTEDVMKHLPEMLMESFPRTYASCMAFGFDFSCGVTFKEILPELDEQPGYLHVDDLDALTLMAIGMEGMMDACDTNGDARLSWSLFDGDDELDCAFTGAKDTVLRLADAEILEASHSDERKMKLGLGVVNSTFVTRAIGKAAMMRGSRTNLLVKWPLFWRDKSASLGSLYGLIADVADHDTVKQLKKQARSK